MTSKYTTNSDGTANCYFVYEGGAITKICFELWSQQRTPSVWLKQQISHLNYTRIICIVCLSACVLALSPSKDFQSNACVQPNGGINHTPPQVLQTNTIPIPVNQVIITDISTSFKQYIPKPTPEGEKNATKKDCCSGTPRSLNTSQSPATYVR